MTSDPWDPPDDPSPREIGPAAQWLDWWRTREVDPVARSQGFVLGTGQLGAAGVSRSAGRHAVRTGRFTAAARGVLGVVAVRDVGDAEDDPAVARRRHALAVAAALRLRPGHVASGRSAAILHGLPTLAVPLRPEITARHPSGNGHRNSIQVFRASVSDDEVDSWFGLPVLSVSRTLVDLARHSRRDGIMAADAALHQDLVTVEQIDRALVRAIGWPGVRRARDVLALASPLAESPLESITRLAMRDDGFPEPELQFRVGALRVDLALVAQRLLIECDGRVKYRGPSGAADGDSTDALWQEKEREHVIRRPGWWVERILWSDVTLRWPETSRRLWRAANRLPAGQPLDPWRL